MPKEERHRTQRGKNIVVALLLVVTVVLLYMVTLAKYGN